MVITCSVVGCSNRHERGKDCSFYYIPKVIDHQGEQAKELSTRRRSAWLASINQSDWTPGPGARVCSVHFISGKPAYLFDETNPDWIPTVNMGYQEYESRNSDADLTVTIDGSEGDLMLSMLEALHNSDQSSDHNSDHDDSEVPGVACQTEETSNLVQCLHEDNNSLRAEIVELKCRTDVSPELLEGNPDMLKFYTGLPNWSIFTALLTLIAPALHEIPQNKLSLFQMVVMFLMKIRLNLFDEDIAYRFSVHRTTVSRNFHKVLDVMAARTGHLIK